MPRTTFLFFRPVMKAPVKVTSNLPPRRHPPCGRSRPQTRNEANRNEAGWKCPTRGPHGISSRNVDTAEYPRRFGSYVLLKRLARGGMGELDLAVTGGRGMEKLCVIKRVLPHLLESDNVQRF